MEYRVIKYGASWCQQCKLQDKEFEKNPLKCPLHKVDVDELVCSVLYSTLLSLSVITKALISVPLTKSETTGTIKNGLLRIFLNLDMTCISFLVYIYLSNFFSINHPR